MQTAVRSAAKYRILLGNTVTTYKELQAIRDAETPPGVGIQTAVYADKAENAELWDVEGKRYIDLAY